MRALRLSGAIGAACWLALAGCGGNDGTGPGNGGNNGGGGNNTTSPMSATIDGQPWSADTATGFATAIQFAPLSGGYLITGLQQLTGGGPGTSLVFTVNNIDGPGTYPLGVDGVSVTGGFASVIQTNSGGGQWTTPFSGAAGTVTITKLTDSTLAGTFAFDADSSGGVIGGTRVVTNGKFDIPIQGNAVVPVLPDSVGGRFSATVGGQAWNAAIISAGAISGRLTVTGINDFQTFIFNIPLPGAPGTYRIDNASGNILQAWDPTGGLSGPRCCWGISGDSGSVSLTSLSSTRAKGTVSATLSPKPGTAAVGIGALVIEDGDFDIGLFHTP